MHNFRHCSALYVYFLRAVLFHNDIGADNKTVPQCLFTERRANRKFFFCLSYGVY